MKPLIFKHPKIKLAAQFAAAAHKLHGQYRKYTGQPYIVHPAEVALLVATVTDDVDVICAAWLHDVAEDTVFDIDVIRALFGDRVAMIVSDLTDVAVPSDGNRAVRVAINRAHTSAACYEAKLIKLCDLISNTKSIVEHDQNFAVVYLKEKELLLEVLQGVNHKIFSMACDSLMQGKLAILRNTEV